MTAGPWKPIKVHHYDARLTDVFAKVNVDTNLAAKINVSFSVSESSPLEASVSLETLDGASIISSQSIRSVEGAGEAKFSFKPGELELWYPIGYGKQHRYTVQVQIKNAVGWC